MSIDGGLMDEMRGRASQQQHQYAVAIMETLKNHDKEAKQELLDGAGGR
jgi:hypothetical protein